MLSMRTLSPVSRLGVAQYKHTVSLILDIIQRLAKVKRNKGVLGNEVKVLLMHFPALYRPLKLFS